MLHLQVQPFLEEFLEMALVGLLEKKMRIYLEMWNKVIAEMSADGTTAEITKKWFGRDISM